MIHHMTQRCALIRIYREVEPLLCYGQERSGAQTRALLYYMMYRRVWSPDIVWVPDHSVIKNGLEPRLGHYYTA